jgi:hypothetical protein
VIVNSPIELGNEESLMSRGALKVSHVTLLRKSSVPSS